MSMTAITRFFAAAALIGCSCKPTPTPAPPPEPPPAGVCHGFCYMLERFKCPGAQGGPGYDEVMGTSDDSSCEVVCTNYIQNTVSRSDEKCIADAKTCSEVETCLMGE